MSTLLVAVAVATIGCHGCGAPVKCGHVVKADCAPVTIKLPKICLPKIELPKLDCLKIKPIKHEKKVVKCEKKKVVKKCFAIKKSGCGCLLGGLGIHKISCKAVKAEKVEAPEPAPKPAPAPKAEKPAPAPAPAPAPEKPAPQPQAEQK